MIRNECTLRKVTIENSFTNNSQLFNSTIYGTTLHRCILFDCTWDQTVKMKHCQIVDRPLSFRRFPVEIRALIFGEVVEYNSKDFRRHNVHYRMPHLIIALRGDPLLHNEALNLFYKTNEFVYRGPNGFRPHQVSAALHRVQRLSIE
jgi:hypothetical protein